MASYALLASIRIISHIHCIVHLNMSVSILFYMATVEAVRA